jgi:hypothetical protein
MDAIQLPLPQPDNPFFGPIIYAYTRAQAIADGILVDVTETGKEVGFKLPVTITEALHNRLTPTKADVAIGQDYDGRLWDVLWLAAFTIKLADRGTDIMTFTVVQQEVEAKNSQPEKVNIRLRAVCGPGDEGEPVFTIGFPDDF